VSAKEHFFSKATAKVLQEFELTKDFQENFSKKYHTIF
jgi:flavoprotein